MRDCLQKSSKRQWSQVRTLLRIARKWIVVYQRMSRLGRVEQEEQAETSEQVVTEEVPVKRSAWIIVECDEFTDDIQEYRRRRRKALLEALLAIREGQKHLSRRVITIWAYQRTLRKAG